MKEEKLQEILNRLEESPDMPLMMLIDNEALDAIEHVVRVHPGAHLVMLRGIRYITITDAALEVIMDRLERERLQFVNVVANYDEEIKGIRELMGSGKKYYWSPACTVPEPALREKGEK